MNDEFALFLGIVFATFFSLLFWAMDLTNAWPRRGFAFLFRLLTGLAGVGMGPADGRFPNARLIDISICQECGYAGPLGQPACPRCGQKERQF